MFDNDFRNFGFHQRSLWETERINNKKHKTWKRLWEERGIFYTKQNTEALLMCKKFLKIWEVFTGRSFFSV